MNTPIIAACVFLILMGGVLFLFWINARRNKSYREFGTKAGIYEIDEEGGYHKKEGAQFLATGIAAEDGPPPYDLLSIVDSLLSERWEALMSSQRIRFIGSALVGKEHGQVLCVEFHSDHIRSEGDSNSGDIYARQQLLKYTEAILNRKSKGES